MIALIISAVFDANILIDSVRIKTIWFKLIEKKILEKKRFHVNRRKLNQFTGDWDREVGMLFVNSTKSSKHGKSFYAFTLVCYNDE